MPRGPRVIFKDDRDSNIRRGCVIYQGMLRPEIICMVAAAAETAPFGMEEMNVSEGWRDSRDDERDLHEELRAWDISARGIGLPVSAAPGFVNRRQGMKEWAAQIRRKLGPAYTVVVHDTGSGLHIHIELDP